MSVESLRGDIVEIGRRMYARGYTASNDGNISVRIGPDRLLNNRSTPGHFALARLEGVKTLTTPNSKTLGRDSFKGMGVDFGDLNGDGLLDMFVANITSAYALEESNFAWVSTGEVGKMRDGVAPYVD